MQEAVAVAPAVAAYILGAYWFTASTSFANPAVTFARAFTNTFTGISLGDVPGFWLSQIVGAIAALAFLRLLEPTPATKPTESEAAREARVG